MLFSKEVENSKIVEKEKEIGLGFLQYVIQVLEDTSKGEHFSFRSNFNIGGKNCKSKENVLNIMPDLQNNKFWQREIQMSSLSEECFQFDCIRQVGEADCDLHKQGILVRGTILL